MKKLLLLILIFSPLSIFATEKCDPNNRFSDTNDRVIEKIVKKWNTKEINNLNSAFKNKTFDIASLDFGSLGFARQKNAIVFWEWISSGWLDWWPCYYPERKYSLTKENSYYEKGKYPKGKKLSYEEVLSELKDNEKYNSYADENSPSLISGSLIAWAVIYETGLINTHPYIVTKGIWEFDGSTNYSLWLIWKKYNYMIQWPHDNDLSDVETWKEILKSVQFISK